MRSIWFFLVVRTSASNLPQRPSSFSSGADSVGGRLPVGSRTSSRKRKRRRDIVLSTSVANPSQCSRRNFPFRRCCAAAVLFFRLHSTQSEHAAGLQARCKSELDAVEDKDCRLHHLIRTDCVHALPKYGPAERPFRADSTTPTSKNSSKSRFSRKNSRLA